MKYIKLFESENPLEPELYQIRKEFINYLKGLGYKNVGLSKSGKDNLRMVKYMSEPTFSYDDNYVVISGIKDYSNAIMIASEYRKMTSASSPIYKSPERVYIIEVFNYNNQAVGMSELMGLSNDEIKDIKKTVRYEVSVEFGEYLSSRNRYNKLFRSQLYR
jgi:hypothetical protein